MDCEASILVRIVAVFQFIINYLRLNDIQGKIVKEIAFQVKFMDTILRLKNMKDFNLSILSKKERSRIVDFLKNSKELMGISVNKK